MFHVKRARKLRERDVAKADVSRETSVEWRKTLGFADLFGRIGLGRFT